MKILSTSIMYNRRPDLFICLLFHYFVIPLFCLSFHRKLQIMHCKASKAPKTLTKCILCLYKDVLLEETMSYQTKPIFLAYFAAFYIKDFYSNTS